MLKLLKKESLFCSVRLGYVIIILLYALLRQNVTALQPYLMHNIYNFAVIMFAGLLFVWQLLFFRPQIKTKYFFVLCGLFAATLISIALNVKYGYMDNLKSAANMFIHFFVLYAVYPSRNYKSLKKDINVIYLVISIAWFAAALISILMYFADFSYMQTSYLWFEPQEIVQGFVHSHYGAVVMRLWGVFVDPNFAAAVSIIIICFALFALKTNKNKVFIAFNVLNIVVQFLYIVLSNSRMALLVTLLLVFVGVWFFALPYLHKVSKNIFVKEIISIVLAVIIVGLTYSGVLITKKVLPYEKYLYQSFVQSLTIVPEETTVEENTTAEENTIAEENTTTEEITTATVNEVTSSEQIATEVPSENTTIAEETIIEATTIPDVAVENLDRQDVVVKVDVSNGRFKLWLEGLQLWKEQPLFGCGPRNYHAVATATNPSLQISTSSIHNSFVEFLVGNGVVGMLLLIAFFILCAKDAIVYRYKKKENCFEIAMLMLVVLCCLACGFFLANLFYYLSFTSMIIFVVLGYAQELIKAKED